MISLFDQYPLLYKFYKFFITSGIGWILDFFIVWVLVSGFGFMPFYANAIGSTAGISFVFFVSLYKIFTNNGKFILFKFIIYVVYSAVLILTMSFFIQSLSESASFTVFFSFITAYRVPIAIVAKIILTPFSMILNFFVLKFIVEKINF